MAHLTHSYSLSATGQDFKDERVKPYLSKNKTLGRYLVSPMNEPGETIVRFITKLLIATQTGALLNGGAQLCITERRIVGLMVEGRGTTGLLSEDNGQIESHEKRRYRSFWKCPPGSGSCSVDPYSFPSSEGFSADAGVLAQADS